MVCRRGIRAPQKSTDGAFGGAGSSIWTGRGGDSAGRRPQHLPGATAVPMREVFGDRHRELWDRVPDNILHTKTEVHREGSISMEDV